jgi:hypothetical protein
MAFEVRVLRFGVWGLGSGFRFQSLGLGVQGLGCGMWGALALQE